MNASQLDQALQVFERVMDLAGDARAAVLDESCGLDTELRHYVVRLLEADLHGGYLEPDNGLLGSVPRPGPPLAQPLSNSMVGAFRVLDILGSGGMGVVYAAEQAYPKRKVALKMLPPSVHRPGAHARFHTEIELLARLDHPGVARVIEAGLHKSAEGVEQPYFAMEFVPGAQDLMTWGAGRSLSSRLRLFLVVCQAIQHGHQQGVIHRDLKPANVLVSESDTPKVIDFGVARAVGAPSPGATTLTQTGEIIGTLQYMAPEQLGSSTPIDTRADVYALGLLLYELIAGEPPYRMAGRPLSEVIQLVRYDAPPVRRSAAGTMPRDLGAVVQHALEKDPARRYQSASELAADLERFLDQRPVEARKPSLGYTLGRFVRRHRAVSTAAAASLVLILVATAISIVAMVQARDQADRFRSINGVLTGMFEDVRLESGGADIRGAELLEHAATRVNGFRERPDLEADLRLTLAESFASLELHGPAAREARRALDLKVELNTAEETQAVYILARSLRWLDRLEDARSVIDEYRADGLAERPEYLKGHDLSLRKLSLDLLVSEGHPGQAADELATLLLESESAFGDGSEGYANVQLSLIHARIAASRFGAALALARTRLQHISTTQSGSARALFEARWMLARCQQFNSQHAEFRSTMDELSPEMGGHYGEHHERSLVFLGDLAKAYLLTGDAPKAVPILEDLHDLRVTRDGASHPETMTVAGNLARALSNAGDERATEALRASFEMRRERLGADHRSALSALFALGRHLRLQGELSQAEPILTEHYERVTAVLSSTELARYRSAGELGLLYLYQKNPAEAAPLFESAWRSYERILPPGDSRTFALGSNFAASLIEQGLLMEGSTILLEVLADMRALLPAADKRFVTVLNNLAYCHSAMGEHQLALERLGDARAWCMDHAPQGHTQSLDILQRIAGTHMTMGSPESALPFLRELVDGVDLNPALRAAKCLEYERDLATCLVASGRFTEAVRAYERLVVSARAHTDGAESSMLGELEASLRDARTRATKEPGAD